VQANDYMRSQRDSKRAQAATELAQDAEMAGEEAAAAASDEFQSMGQTKSTAFLGMMSEAVTQFKRAGARARRSASVSISQHQSASVSISQHQSASVSIG